MIPAQAPSQWPQSTVEVEQPSSVRDWKHWNLGPAQKVALIVLTIVALTMGTDVPAATAAPVIHGSTVQTQTFNVPPAPMPTLVRNCSFVSCSY